MTRRSAKVAAAGGAMIALGLLAAPAPVLPTAAARAETGVTATTITIGIQATVTGAAPYPQNAFDIGKDVYWKYIAAKGGIFGRNVQVLVRDDRFDTQTALNVCGDLVDVQKVFILLELGPASPDEITACARYAASKGVPYLSAGANQDGLTGLATYFATSQTYAQQHPAVVSYIKNVLHKTRLAIVVTNTASLNEAQQSITQQAQMGGLNIVRNSRISKIASDSEMQSEANALRISGAEVVYLLTAPVNFTKLATNAQAQAYNPIYMGPGTTSGLNLVAQVGCPAIGAAKFFSPFPGLDVIDNLDPAYKTSYQKYNGSVPPADDVGLAEWGLAKLIGAVLQATGADLTRQSFMATLQSGKEFATNVYPAVSYSSTARFGAKSAHLLEADCANSPRRFKTIAQFTTGF